MLSRRISLSKFLTGTPTSSSAPSDTSSGTISTASASNGAEDPQKGCAIKVVIRARPLSDRELLAKTPVIVNVTRTSIQVINPVVFLDPTYLEAISSPTKRVTQRDLPIALSAQGVSAAIAAGECRTFHFDRCFGVDNAVLNDSEPFANTYDIDFTTQRPNQELIFDEIGRDMIESAFQGFNCTVLAYGQTGSGKTHTMVGEKTHKGKGLIPRVCEALFTAIDARRAKESESEAESETGARTDSDSSLNGESVRHTGSSTTLYSATVSYCEIYKEKVNDLLEASSSSMSDSSSSLLGKTRSPPLSPSWNGSEDSSFGGSGSSSAPLRRTLRVREHPTTGPFVEGLSSRPVTSYADIAEEMLAGEKLRTVASTLMNPVSSRSHAVFTITFTQTTFDPTTQATMEKTSKISMIDLAGSERANASGTSGDRLKEGAMINKSLTTLGRVISALSKQGGERVPYRDSTLTWLLKESLGGNAKTTMIAMVSPSSDNYDETMSTLRYAESAKRVLNRAVINEDKNARIIRQLRQEIQELRAELEMAQRSPRKRIASSAATDAPAVVVAEVTASLAERDEFQSQLLQELEHLRSIQAQSLPPSVVPKTGTQMGTTHVHKTLPSLVVNVTKHFKPESALAYTLSEGKTVFGSDEGFGADKPDDKVSAQESKLSIDTSAEAKENTESASPPKRGWSPTFLRRRSSSTLAAANTAATAGSESPKTEKLSPMKRGMSRRKSSSVSDNMSSSVSDNIATTFHHLSPGKEGDIFARHVQIICTKLLSADDESTDLSEPVYSVEVEPLKPSARVLLNGKSLPTIGEFSGSSGGTRVEMRHGDQLQLGDSRFFSLYIPQVAMRSDPPAIEPEAPVSESLAELVDEANCICAKWNLHMEFALKSIGDGDENFNYSDATGNADDEADVKVIVKKHLDGQRFSLVEWKRPMLEAKVAFLRQFAASLEDAGSIVVLQEDSTTRSEASAIAEEEKELHDRESTASSQAKLSVYRAPNTVSEADEINGFPRLEPQAHSSSSSIGGSHQSSPLDSLALSNCIRLIGQGRIFMPPLKSYSNGPMIAVVLDAAGYSIGRLFMHLQYTTIASEKSSERRSSLLSLARSASASFLSATLSPTSASASTKLKAAQSTIMRIHLDKIVFDESQAMASDGVSLTLKKWSNLSSNSNDKKAKSSNGSNVSASDMGLATNFSTPKIPPLSNEKATTTYAPLKIFQINKVFETRLCFADLTVQPGNSASESAGEGLGSVSAAQDDFVAFEVWGYGKTSLPSQNSSLSVAQGLESISQASPLATPSVSTRKVDFYVSVDIDEREPDGIFRPVAVKADGALRIHANQPRRLNVRVTQADQQQFVLSTIAAVQISPSFSTNCDSASLSASSGGTNKSTQWLLSPSSMRSQQQTIQSMGTDGNGGFSSGTAETWRALEFRGASEQDASSRSLSVSLKWDRDSRRSECVDSEGSRRVFRVVLALTTPWSRVPIVVCKSVVTKISSAVVTTKLKLTRELESSRTAWWARESFSREYRLGTWYTADVAISAKENNSQEALIEQSAIADQDEEQPTSEKNSYETVVLQAVVNSYIRGLLRLEIVLELEHLRQQVLKMISFSTTETVSRDNLDEHHQLTFDKVTEALSTLFENGDDQEQRFEIVQLHHNARQLFLRKKTQRELLVGVKYGNVVDVSPSDGANSTIEAPGISKSSSTWRGELHVAHFVTEPSHLASGLGGEMSGFLMLSTAFSLDEAAIAPLTSVGTTGTPLKAEKLAKQVKASWERRWFVLKRPFLYAYKTFALKEEVGVLDISKSQLLTSPSSSTGGGGSAGNDWSHPSALSISHASASSSLNSSASGPKTTSRQSANSNHVLASTPFSFQIVCLVGVKCVVWTLQASTALEMRAWLVAIDPLKIEAREAVVNSQGSSVETPVVTA